MSIDTIDRRFDICQYVLMPNTVLESSDVRPPADEPVPALCCAPLVRAPLSEGDADELAAILKAIADPVRLRLVSIIASAATGEVCACDLPELVDRSQPTVSHHLSLLVKAGIVDREQRGKWAWFRLRPDRLAAVAGVLTEPT